MTRLRRALTGEVRAYGMKVHRGGLATVYACPCCSHIEKFSSGRPGVGRGHGLRNGGGCYSRMVAHIRATHPEQPKETDK